MKFPFDDLNMCDREHVEWVKSQRDPELWHAAAMAVVNTLGDPCGFLAWMADQPEMDRATAGYVFLHYGPSYLRGRADFSGGEGLSGDEWLNALTAVCRRAATIGFTHNLLGRQIMWKGTPKRRAFVRLTSSCSIVASRRVFRADGAIAIASWGRSSHSAPARESAKGSESSRQR